MILASITFHLPPDSVSPMQATGEMRVYDVTEYVEEHPGGPSILNNAGGDSTGLLTANNRATRTA